MLRRVALVRIDVSEEHITSTTRFTKIGKLGTTLAMIGKQITPRMLLLAAIVLSSSPIFATLLMEAIRSSETLVLTRVTRRNIPKDDSLLSHRRKNLKSYTV
jgi:hypothetical protein